MSRDGVPSLSEWDFVGAPWSVEEHGLPLELEMAPGCQLPQVFFDFDLL